VSPRCRKPRRCRCTFKGTGFRPAGIPVAGRERVTLSRDELETLKLCDGDGLTQAGAGSCMGVSRGTVQRTLAQARAKVATALACGQVLVFARRCARGTPRSSSQPRTAPSAGRQERKNP
jgi:predicted DNA-binding protein (UPF0251 family)